MINVRDKKHLLSGLGLRELEATFSQAPVGENQIEIRLANLKAIVALHRPEGTCGQVHLHAGLLSEKTRTTFLELVTLLEQDAKNLLFSE